MAYNCTKKKFSPQITSYEESNLVGYWTLLAALSINSYDNSYLIFKEIILLSCLRFINCNWLMKNHNILF